MSRRTTLADIAREAGVSKTTVWLTMKNSPKIPVKTRERILGLAEKLGYRPDPVLSSMARARWKDTEREPETVAWLEEPAEWKANTNQYLAQAREQAKAHGYRVERFELRYEDSPARLGELLWKRGIRAILVHHLFRPAWRTEFPWERFVAVAVQPNRYSKFLHRAKSSGRCGCAMAFRQILGEGYHRIGVVLHHTRLNPIDPARMGALLYIRRILQEAAPKVPVLDLTDSSNHPKQIRDWMKKQKPEAVLGLTPSVVHLLSEAGYIIPTDVAFATLTRSSAVDRRIAGIDPNHRAMLSRAVGLLDQLLKANAFGIPDEPYDIVVPQVWHNGQTLPHLGPSLLDEETRPELTRVRELLDEMV